MLEHKSKKIAANSRWGCLKTFDIYAKPITMTYKGKEKFRSKFGGLVSLILLLFIISIFAYKFRDMINRNQT